jgi:hypothetical protein
MKHNYTAKLERMLAAAGPVPPGCLVSVEIAHKPGCKLLRGKTRCTCDPDIRLVTTRPRGGAI